MGKTNRLFALLGKFLFDSEIPHQPDEENLEVDVGIHTGDELIRAKWKMDSKGNSYQWGASLGEVSQKDVNRISGRILKSSPIIGVTERIVGNKLVALSERGDQAKLTNTQVRQNFMDDIARIVKAADQAEKILPSRKK